MTSDEKKYFVVFDTNVLYQNYDKRGDFTTFSFNSTYENVVGFINQLDIYEHVVLMVPTVVWSEMRQQIIDAHQTKIDELRGKLSKHQFPELETHEKSDIDYPLYIGQIIDRYRESLSS